MTKLHEIFLNNKKDFDHGKTIKELVQREGLNINAVDEDGNSVLHIMAMHVYENYHNPYFYKVKPDLYSGFSGDFHYTNYQGPSFFEDLEVLLSLGADPSLMNKKSETAIDLLNKLTPFVHISSYFVVLQNFYPDASLLIKAIETGALLSEPRLREKCIAIRNTYRIESWINIELPKLLDARLLPMDSLETLVKWIDTGAFNELGASEKTAGEIRERLLAEIDCQKSGIFLIPVVNNLAQLYEHQKNTLIRGMLLNDPPVYSLIEQLYQLANLEQLLPDNLYNIVYRIVSAYEEARLHCEELKAHPEPLNVEERKVVGKITDQLLNTLNGKIEYTIARSFNKRIDYAGAKNYMASRWRLFQESSGEQSKAVVEELKHRNMNIIEL